MSDWGPAFEARDSTWCPVCRRRIRLGQLMRARVDHRKVLVCVHARCVER